MEVFWSQAVTDTGRVRHGKRKWKHEKPQAEWRAEIVRSASCSQSPSFCLKRGKYLQNKNLSMWFWLSLNNGYKGDFEKTVIHIDYSTSWWDFGLFVMFSWCHFHDIYEDFVDFKWHSILFSQQIIYKIRQNGLGKIPSINTFLFPVSICQYFLWASS